MKSFKLLRPEEVVSQWGRIAPLLDKAVGKGSGELDTDDIRKLVLGGRMFLFGLYNEGDLWLAITAEFITYPKKTVMLVGFGGGRGASDSHEAIRQGLNDFARKAGASSVQAFCKDESVIRLNERLFGAQRRYTVMEYAL